MTEKERAQSGRKDKNKKRGCEKAQKLSDKKASINMY